MNEQKERNEAIKIAKQAFERRYGRIYNSDIALLETSFDGKRIDYVLFKNKFTGWDYRVDYSETRGKYYCEEVED